MPANIIDCRLHGRGGQGVMTSSYLIAEAALEEEKYVHAFPTFGPERSGAPIAAFARVSDEKFYQKEEVTNPNIVVVQDNSLLGQVNILAGLEKNGIVLINIDNPDAEAVKKLREARPDAKFGFVDASKIAHEEIGLDVTNTAILGGWLGIIIWLMLVVTMFGSMKSRGITSSGAFSASLFFGFIISVLLMAINLVPNWFMYINVIAVAIKGLSLTSALSFTENQTIIPR